MMTNKHLVCSALALLIFMFVLGCAEKKSLLNSNVDEPKSSSVIETITSGHSGTTAELPSGGTSNTSAVTSGNVGTPEIYVPDKGLIDDDGDNGGIQTTTSPKTDSASTSNTSVSTASVSPASTSYSDTVSTSSTASTSQSIITYDLYPSKPAGFAGGVY